MALSDKIGNAKKVLADTRSRLVVVILCILVIMVLILVYVRFKRSQSLPAGMASSINAPVPEITSIPGLGQPTREYAKLQEQQNEQLAQDAARRGTAALPTIVRTTYVDSGISTDLSSQSGAASVAGCGVEELKQAREAGVSAVELRCRGCSLAALKAAGFTAGELRAAGFSAEELKDAGFSAAELREAGFNAEELKKAGFNAKELAAAGFTAGELRRAGFSHSEINGAGYGKGELQNAGFSNNNNSEGNCSIEKAREARTKGVSATELRKLGCSAAALRAAGFTASELKAAGFSAGELRDAGFSASELRAAGFTAKDLKDAGFSASELKAAGFSASELKAAGFSAGDLKAAGFSAAELKAAGFSAADLKKAGFAARELVEAGYSVDELKAAGYTNGDLTRAGIIVADNAVSPCSIESLKKSRAEGISAGDLKKLGCSVAALREVGFTAKELKAAGFSLEELQAAGFTAKDLQDAGFKVAAPVSNLENGTANNVTLQDNLGRLTYGQVAALSDTEYADLVRQTQISMATQANQLIQAWAPISMQQYVKGEPNIVEGESTDAASGKDEANVNKNKVDLKNNDIYKAGNIIFAVLDTEVNSDENSPVMATIVQGDLKGSKVIGNFQRVEKKVLISFSVLSIPRLDSSMAIQAVAIDPNTSKPPMASDVDNHYLLRYGTVLASGFLSGFGEAFQKAGSQIETTSSGTVSTMPALTVAQKGLVGLGTMAQQFNAAISEKAAKAQPTVRVKAGVSIGILLMADLVVPKDNKKG